MPQKKPSFGYPIPAATTVNWTAARVRHFVYQFRPATEQREKQKNLPVNSLVLFKTEVGGTQDTFAKAADLETYVGKLASGGYTYPIGNAEDVDIAIEEQCWIIIELEKTINWHFGRTYPAVLTGMEEEPFDFGGVTKSGFNADLRYAFSNGYVTDDPSTAAPDAMCRFVYFRAILRKDKTACKMNFVVELFTEMTGGIPGRSIPIIIDPDVPDDGNNGFPSPP